MALMENVMKPEPKGPSQEHIFQTTRSPELKHCCQR